MYVQLYGGCQGSCWGVAVLFAGFTGALYQYPADNIAMLVQRQCLCLSQGDNKKWTLRFDLGLYFFGRVGGARTPWSPLYQFF